ncbi:purine-nucleoside phosphorylase [Lacticaseibacillus nasuensis]|uniref:purine-nucleoside phosphorylase n=1 Tax=Lacticaseibacillus nasuensis TaxID=944671 RepID=UPI00224857E7|nr:purine-nucleoside phosphorylase [Lacticaseibacillus nasuensis]MCX2456017.1 purine-nucleoside phosphorylase [Lacticaseibacillus nasuensis]
MSVHIAATANQVAETVLLPGDPLRARFIAENFLTSVKQYTDIRNVYGYTGSYRGQPVSVQATGMGIPSFSVYATELIKEYNVQTLIRVGTVGSLQPTVRIRDLVLVQGSSTDSSIVANTFGPMINFSLLASFSLLQRAANLAEADHLAYHVGNVLGEDRYYNDEIDRKKLVDYGILATEMETPALYLLAAKYQRRALSILTVSNSLLTGEETSTEDRETSFTNMIQLALATAAE